MWRGVLWLVRHLFAVVVLPFTVVVLIPRRIARRSGTVLAVAGEPLELFVQTVGVVLLAVGIALFVASLGRFAAEGRGTLAPWDPPRHLVIRGPYRHVRNPMISGVVLVLFGLAAVLRSRPHFIWALTFFAINAVYIPLVEEPALRARFGAQYDEYCRRVPRLIPRLRPLSSPVS